MKRWTLLWPAENPRCHSFALGRLPGGPVEQRQTKQPKCLHPKPWVLNIAGSCQTILIPSIYILKSTAVELSLCNKSMGFLGDASDPPVAIPTNCQERRQVFAQIETIWDSITEITRPAVSSFNNLPVAKAWYQPPLFTFFSSPFLSAEPSRHHEMQSPRLLANLWLQFCLKLWWTKSLILKHSLDPFKSVTFCKPIPHKGWCHS